MLNWTSSVKMSRSATDTLQLIGVVLLITVEAPTLRSSKAVANENDEPTHELYQG